MGILDLPNSMMRYVKKRTLANPSDRANAPTTEVMYDAQQLEDYIVTNINLIIKSKMARNILLARIKGLTHETIAKFLKRNANDIRPLEVIVEEIKRIEEESICEIRDKGARVIMPGQMRQPLTPMQKMIQALPAANVFKDDKDVQ